MNSVINMKEMFDVNSPNVCVLLTFTDFSTNVLMSGKIPVQDICSFRSNYETLTFQW